MLKYINSLTDSLKINKEWVLTSVTELTVNGQNQKSEHSPENEFMLIEHTFSSLKVMPLNNLDKLTTYQSSEILAK